MWRMRTRRKDIEKHTHLYWVLIMGMVYTHLDVGGGRTLLHCVCMHVHGTCWAETYLYWTLVSITIGTNTARLAWCWIYFVFVFTTHDAWPPLSTVLIAAVCMASSRGLDVDS